MSYKNGTGSASDPVVKPVEIEIFGKKYGLVWSFRAIAEIEKHTGLKLLVEGLSIRAFGVAEFVGLLYAGLRKCHPKITYEEAGDLLDGVNIGDLLDALTRARKAHFPDPPVAVSETLPAETK